ncbi:hypothetical protein PAAG_12222 [Paracoccidioides lutzii Pb01]|uniref:Uncharacterized protein n=1 Tax=Paracoccidioides lutzii (strain ATCC MYA-826 / Pb01) TaxID=502779 RepID=A0A0A2VJN9_PARBA|nr:hypothetical protein PAAG_12222 [Paracoccidioides lutzii Pb01]KGQ01094.1 hypothetical protein PAAG_12222 [Paracoccidioides lutzii Pb01]
MDQALAAGGATYLLSFTLYFELIIYSGRNLPEYTSGLIDTAFSRIPNERPSLNDQLPFHGTIQEHIRLINSCRATLQVLIKDYRPELMNSGSEPITGVLIDSVGHAVVGMFLNPPLQLETNFCASDLCRRTQNEILAAFEHVTESNFRYGRSRESGRRNCTEMGRKKRKEVKVDAVDFGYGLSSDFADGGNRFLVATRQDSHNGFNGWR